MRQLTDYKTFTPVSKEKAEDILVRARHFVDAKVNIAGLIPGRFIGSFILPFTEVNKIVIIYLSGG